MYHVKIKDILKTLILYVPIIGAISCLILDYPSVKDGYYPLSNNWIFYTSAFAQAFALALIVLSCLNM